MAKELQGRRVAILATDGVEQVELTKPRDALHQAGARTDLINLKPGKIQGFNHLDKGDTFPVDRTVSEARVEDYDALVLPGGVANPDALRIDEKAVAFVRRFGESGKPIAAICHAPWTLIEAGIVRGRTLTSWPSLQTDIRNAGGNWVDRDVQVDGDLVTSRKPDDLPAFCAKLIEVFAAGGRESAATGASADRGPSAPSSDVRDSEGTPYSEDRLDETSADSFPASDPPSFTPEKA